MKKIIYINFDFDNYKTKTKSQLKSFRKFNYVTYLIRLSDNELLLDKITNDNTETLAKQKINYSRKNKIKYYKIINNFIISAITQINPDFVYIRRICLNVIFLNLKKISKLTKILYELPTYPFDYTDSIKLNFYQSIEKIYLMKIAVRYITLYPAVIQNVCKKNDKKIFEISNGVDIDSYNISKRRKRKIDEKFNLVAIAHVNNWHGYDRVINSIDNKNITFTIYSKNTEEIEKLKLLVNKKGLNNQVIFKKLSDDVDIIEEINQYDVAVGGIGYYRRKALYDTSIKNKEYCAMAIPFIYTCKDKMFTENFKYSYKVISEDKNIDLNDIYNWYKEINSDDYITYMYTYAKNNLSYDISIEKILKYMEGR